MDVLGRDSDISQGSIRVVRGCPCYKVFGNERLCVNDDEVLEVEVIEVDPSLFAFNTDKESMKKEQAAENNICYAAIYVNNPDNKVYCISQGWVLRIHGKDVPGNDLEDALQFLSTKDLTDSAEICSECLYKFILTLGDTFADLMSRKEKTDEVKKYVDKFSLMIAVKHSQMDEMMNPIGTEDEIDEGVDHFAFLRSYLVQLLEQQHSWHDLHRELEENDADQWLMNLVSKREKLARLEFQFYSQTLQLRDIADFHLMIKMLQFVLKSSAEILTINEEIHDLIRSKEFTKFAKEDDRFDHLSSYGSKSRTVEHNFGNILQILSKL
ncbi:MAG: hypothetical protein ACXAEF_02890 [Candidatus Thorarchaeota archaeon]|jgi:hypothetical protein